MRLEIDKLVVGGVRAADSARLAELVERELESLITSRGLSAAADLELPGGVFEMPSGLSVEQVAARVAESIWQACRGTVPHGAAGSPATAPGSDRVRPPAGGDERGGE